MWYIEYLKVLSFAFESYLYLYFNHRNFICILYGLYPVTKQLVCLSICLSSQPIPRSAGNKAVSQGISAGIKGI